MDDHLHVATCMIACDLIVLGADAKDVGILFCQGQNYKLSCCDFVTMTRLNLTKY